MTYGTNSSTQDSKEDASGVPGHRLGLYNKFEASLSYVRKLLKKKKNPNKGKAI